MSRFFMDMTGREVVIDSLPERIVSVVPSQTELLFDLGLEERVVGITKFCVHPEHWFRNKTRVGGTKQLHIDRIRALQPDLVIANKEENEREQIEQLAEEFPVWVSDIRTVAHGLQMIAELGRIVNKEQEAHKLTEEIVTGFDALRAKRLAQEQRRVAYFIWYKPWMSVGGDTFISDMIEQIGWINVLKNRERYPELTLNELKALQPELVLLSSEPYPFKEKHVDEIAAVLPRAEVKLVDGEMFSWYGSRMRQAPAYFRTLLAEQ